MLSDSMPGFPCPLIIIANSKSWKDISGCHVGVGVLLHFAIEFKKNYDL